MRKIAFLVPLLVLGACSGGEEAAPGRKAAATPALAGGPSLDGPILTTAGLWRTTSTLNGKQVLGGNRTCVDRDSQKADETLDPPADSGCQPPARRAIAGGYAYDLVCEKDRVKTVVAGEVKGDARHVVMTSTTRMTGPDGVAMPPATVVIDSTYVGPCPGGMKPGDSVQETAAAS